MSKSVNMGVSLLSNKPNLECKCGRARLSLVLLRGVQYEN